MVLTSPLHVLEDSGVPPGSTDYTSVVILHGYAWHSGIFSKLIPYAHPHNARLLLVNRRDYPGSVPYMEADRALLRPLTPEVLANPDALREAKEGVEAFMKARARELYDFLEELVKTNDVRPVDRQSDKGGIIVAGWSLGSTWMTALLAHVASFPVGDVKLGDYMRRVVLFDPPYHSLGYPPPEPPLYNPLFDEELPLEDREGAFTKWVSGYYVHGDTLDTLERRAYLLSPPPTLSTLTSEDVQRTLCLPPGEPGGSDQVLLHTAIGVGLFGMQRDQALYLPAPGTPIEGDAWPDVEVRHVLGERSICEAIWGAMMLRKEVEAGYAQGLPIRRVRMVSIKGANHFVQWDQPELALRSLVGDEDTIE
ncbi:hypothetical protein OH77DRAFT_1446728 [Trametes cingulata]|nr:hypothetical protein OH77DRAFT_1446728 [Trametes cingulata]